MYDSVLTSIKKLLGMPEEYTPFDPDLIIHINSVFSILHQLGVGPDVPFTISGKDETWNEFIQDETQIEMVKSYVYMKCRLIFDPPTIGSLMEALKQQIEEFEWRLNVVKDNKPVETPREKVEEVNWGD